MVVRDIERDEIEFISETLNCLPISHVDHMRPDKLGHADLVESENVSHCCAVEAASPSRLEPYLASDDPPSRCLDTFSPALT